VARDAERPSDEAVQQLFELSLDMLGTSEGGYFTELNPAWEHWLGWTREELMAVPFISFVHPDDVEATRGRGTVFADPDGDAVVTHENRYRTRTGDYRWLNWTTVSVDGVLYFAARDVTDRKARESREDEAERLIRHSEALHRTLTANLPDTTIFLLDPDLRVLVAEGEAIRRLGFLDEDMFRGRLVSELYAEVPDEVLQLCLENYRAGLCGERRAFEFSSDGLTFAVQAVPVRAEDGTIESLLVVARDVSERARASEHLARRALQQNAVAGFGRFALESHDLDALLSEVVRTATETLGVDVGRVLALDGAGERLIPVATVGMPAGVADVRGLPLSLVDTTSALHPLRTGEPTITDDMAAESRFKPSPTLTALGIVSSLSVAIEGYDEPFGVLNVSSREPHTFTADEAEFLSALATLIIIAVERDRGEQVTRHAALHDPLTGLPNRTLAIDRLAQALARRHRERIDLAVFVLDVDGFKLINDSLGHAAGDEVLLELAPRLRAALRMTDTVARLGGDEFVVICPDVDGPRGATDVAERLRGAISRPLSLSSGEHFFSVSIGGTLAATKTDTPESLLGDADAAMYRAKARGRGGYELFDEAMRTALMARVRTETELRRALAGNELEVYYQPVIELATGRPVSTEALVRWNHPERGLVMPLDFIPIAEETGLIALLGLQVLEHACRQTARWQREIDPAIGASVNVSGRQALNPLLPAQVAAIAQRSGLRPGTLALEITETVLMEEADSPTTVLDSLQQHGLSLVLDDFGTGYSSLSRLKRFPLDVLKVDRSFVSGVDCNTDDRAIVKATIDMAHAVGLTVVAEGVETTQQEDCLRELGCDHAQGYLYARPQPAAAITELLSAALA
jgi:diguanylate cyclase (GGDEF)-like protein/PAS domain S-box-containing protein